MKLAFCLFKYFPFGGLQRDFLHITEVCRNRGHSIHVFTMNWKGGTPQGVHVSLISAGGVTNHKQCLNFSKKVSEELGKEHFDSIIGFNKMHCLDIYYAADPCYKAKVMAEKGSLYRLGSRYRTYLALEKAVFDSSAQTHILLISGAEKMRYMHYYNTPSDRFHSLPPGLSRDRLMPADSKDIRGNVRAELDIAEDELCILMVGSSFKTKGLDRSLFAIASLPEQLRTKVKLFVIGEGKEKPFKDSAHRLKIAHQLYFLGGRDDVSRFMLSADLLLHPAYSENTGTVLIEAMSLGLPVLATDICGYAFHVRDAGAGLLVPSPFRQQALNNLLLRMITSPDREMWKRKGIEYVKTNDFFSMPEKAADIIESLALKKGAS